MNNKNQRTMVILAVIFILPIALAKLALEMDFFEQAATNKGQLIQPPISIDALDLPEHLKDKWLLMMVIRSECDNECQNAIYAIKQIHTALGREMDRAEAVVVSTEALPVKELKLNSLQISEQNINSLFKDHPIDDIFIADPLGNVMLRYTSEQQPQQMIMLSRDILSDLKKLLKLSKIG